MKAKISRMQVFLLIPNILFGKAIGITSGVIVRKLGADTWISMTFGFIIGGIIISLLTYLASKFPDKTIINYSEELLGKWIGKLIGVLLIIFFSISFATSANVLILHLKEYFLPETPFIVLCLIYTLLCLYGVYLGIEVVIRFSLLGLIMLLLITIAMVTGTMKDFKFINLLPLMDKGLLANIQGSIYTFSDLSMAIFTIGMLYPMLNIKKKAGRIFLGAVLLSAIMIIVWPFFEIGVMGDSVMKQYIIVCMEQIRCAQFTRYLPRYELLMVSFFIFSIFIQSVAMFYCAAHCIKQVLSVKKDTYIIFPLGAILLFLTFFMGFNINNFAEFLSYPWPQFCVILSIGIPFLLFFAAFFRGKLIK